MRDGWNATGVRAGEVCACRGGVCERAIAFLECECVDVFFFFSSRRRHTRFDCDWSSDVCSSDLTRQEAVLALGTLPDKGGADVVRRRLKDDNLVVRATAFYALGRIAGAAAATRSEEHTSELQSQSNLVCRLLLEKKNNERITSSS